MIERFKKIKNEFGGYVFFRVLLMLIALPILAAIDIFAFSSYISLIIAVVGLATGFFLKNIIPKGAEYYQKILTVGLFIYGIILFAGDRFGIQNHWKLAIITATTVIAFNLQFWSFSDKTVFNPEKKPQK